MKNEIIDINIKNQYKILIKKIEETTVSPNDFSKFIHYLLENDHMKQLEGLIGLKKLLNQNKANDYSLKAFNSAIPHLIIFIEKKYTDEYFYEALSSLLMLEKSNYKITNEIKSIINENILKNYMIYLSKPENPNFKKLLLKYLDLIMVKNENRLIFIKSKKIDILLDIIKNNATDIYTIKKCLKIMSKIFKPNKNKNIELFDTIDIMNYSKMMFNIIINNINIISIIKYATYILSITLQSIEQNLIINEIIKINLIPMILEIIEKEEDTEALFNCLRILGDMVMNENNDYSQKFIEANGLEIIKKTLNIDYDDIDINIRKESSLLISNIAAGNSEQINKLIEAEYYPILYNIIKDEEESQVKRNCLWAIYNFSLLKNQQYLLYIIHQGFLDIIKERLFIDTGDTLSCSIEALDNIIKFSRNNSIPDTNIIENEIKHLNFIQSLQNLKNISSDETLKSKINNIFINYYPAITSD